MLRRPVHNHSITLEREAALHGLVAASRNDAASSVEPLQLLDHEDAIGVLAVGAKRSAVHEPGLGVQGPRACEEVHAAGLEIDLTDATRPGIVQEVLKHPGGDSLTASARTRAHALELLVARLQSRESSSTDDLLIRPVVCNPQADV